MTLADELRALHDRVPATTMFFREREVLSRAADRLTVNEAMVERAWRAFEKSESDQEKEEQWAEDFTADPKVSMLLALHAAIDLQEPDQ